MNARLSTLTGVGLVLASVFLLPITVARANDCDELQAQMTAAFGQMNDLLNQKSRTITEETERIRNYGNPQYSTDPNSDYQRQSRLIWQVMTDKENFDKQTARLKDRLTTIQDLMRLAGCGSAPSQQKSATGTPSNSTTPTATSPTGTTSVTPTSPTTPSSAASSATTTPAALPPETFVPSPSASASPTDTTTPTNLTPTDDTSPSKAPAPLPPVTFGGLGLPAPSYSPAQAANLPAIWCVIARTVMVIPGQTTTNHSAARCNDVPALGADWRVMEGNLTFPQANQIRDRLNGNNQATVWCVIGKEARRSVIRCDNTFGAGPGWIPIASNLTWAAASQLAFGTPSAAGPAPPSIALGAPVGPTAVSPQVPGLSGGQPSLSAGWGGEPYEAADLPLPTRRVGDSPECQRAQQSYESGRDTYLKLATQRASWLKSFGKIYDALHDSEDPEERAKAIEASGMIPKLLDDMMAANYQIQNEQNHLESICGFQIGSKWYPPKWKPGMPPSNQPPPIIQVNAPPALPPKTVPLPAPPAPLPPTTVIPQSRAALPPAVPAAGSAAGCAKRYSCVYRALDPHGASSSWAYQMDVCVPPSGDWSAAGCTIDATRMDHVYAGASGPDTRTTCNPTRD